MAEKTYKELSITKEEFQKRIEDGFWWWTSQSTRPAYSWYLSLREWADMRFNQEYEKEHPNG